MPPKKENQIAPSTSAAANKDTDGGAIGVLGVLMMGFSYIILILFFPLSLIFTVKVVQEYERLVVYRLGRLQSSEGKGPGLVLVLPCIDNVRIVDLRTRSSDLRPQKVLTKDSLAITIDAVVFARIMKMTRSLCQTPNPHGILKLRAATALRKFVGTITMNELLSDRALLTSHVKKTVERSIRGWGMKIEKIDLKEIKMPQDMQRAMATEAETERKAKAKVISAEGEMRASHMLREAADVLSSPTAVNLRCLQTMLHVSKKNCNTVVLPVPENIGILISQWMKKTA